MSRLPVNQLQTEAKELHLGDAKVYHLPNWHSLTHPQRLAVIRQLAQMRGRDPRIAKLALSIIKRARVRPRQYKQQAAALLAWVQSPRNVFYVNEPGERLQDPIYTVKIKHGDCDDQVALLCALFEAVALPWKLCLAGRSTVTKEKVRYIEGEPVPENVTWSHIYCMVGAPPFTPNVWWFCETTIEGVPLGWDVINGDSSYLPEMGALQGPARIEMAAPRTGKRAPVPAPEHQSPAYAVAMGTDLGGPSSAVGAFVGAATAATEDSDSNASFAARVGEAILIGTVTGVAVTLLLDVFKPLVPRLQRTLGLVGAGED